MNLLCPICYNNMDTKEDEIHTTSCGHIFHLRPCLETALKSTSLCPKCRKYNVKHFQLFFEHADEDDEVAAGGAGAVGGLSKDTEYLSKQIRQLERKLDNISTSVAAASSSKASTSSSSLSATRRSNSTASYHRHESRGYNFYDNYFDSTEERDNRAIKKLKEENADLREIVEMERIVGMNNDKEIQNLKEEVRERNDLINLLQVQNDDLREEKMILESKATQQPAKSSIDDLLKL